jgi:hypothetical protein
VPSPSASNASARNREPKSWLTRYIGVQRRYDAEIERMLREAEADVDTKIRSIMNKPGIGAKVRRTQLVGTRGALHRTIASLWRAMGELIQAGRRDAAAAAIAQSLDWDDVLLRKVLPSRDRAELRASLLATSDRNIESVVARITRSKLTLSAQVYRTRALSLGWVDRAVNSGLARGDSADDIAKTVRGFINPDTPGGVSYAAKRLARTEINNAYHAVTIEHASDKPWITGMVWRLSKSHPRPDVCDRLAAASPYPAGEVPPKGHPQCLCTVYPDTVTADEFERQYRLGTYDGWLSEQTGTSARLIA